MKKIIALFGIANSGKTTTLQLVHKALLKAPNVRVIVPNKGRSEVFSIIAIGSCKIGIETQGDPGGRLADSLREFKAKGCSLIICATRTYGKTCDAVEGFNSSFVKSWRRQSDVSEPSLRTESNNAIAKMITKEALDAAHA